MRRAVVTKISKELLDAYNDLRRSLTRELGDTNAAADVAQSSFEKALKYSRDNQVESPRGLLFRMARNIRIDSIRREKRLTFTSMGDSDSTIAEGAEPTLLHPERIVAASQILDQVTDAIGLLPPRCQEAFILNRQHGLSYAEVAERMGISVSQVEKYMVRSIRACREVLER